MEAIILVGYGGHAKSVADSIEREGKYRIVGYTDYTEHISRYTYLGKDDILPVLFSKGIRNAFVCVGYLGKGNTREKLYNFLLTIGFNIPSVIDPSAIVSDCAKIGEGTFVGKGAIINAEAEIGKMCIINSKALVEHECYVGDFSHISVGAVLCGQVTVEKASFIGANATVIQQRVIKENGIVPAGATVR